MPTVWTYLAALRGQLRTIVAGTVLGVLIAGLAVIAIPTSYSSTVTLYISSASSDSDPTAAYQASLLSEQRVKSYVQLLQSQRLASDALRLLGRPDDPAEFAEEIDAASAPDTVLLSATVEGSSPEDAVRVANAVGESFVALVRQLEQPATPTTQPSVVARIVQPGTFATEPTAPRPVLYIAIGLLIGAFLGTATALLRTLLDSRVKDSGGLEKASGVAVLGSIPASGKFEKNAAIFRTDPKGEASEEFRRLRANLQFVDVDQELKCIMVTSSVPGEGKSTTVVNLALAGASAGLRVLIVEADLRRPKAASYLGLDNTAGLTSVLFGRAPLPSVVQSISGGVDLLASGQIPPNPSEIVGSNQMKKLVDALRSQYDLILVDAPPVLPVPDALALGQLTDGALVVCRSSHTTIGQVEATVRGLQGVAIRVVGSVLTMREPAPASSSYHEYYEPKPEAIQVNGDAVTETSGLRVEKKPSPRRREASAADR